MRSYSFLRAALVPAAAIAAAAPANAAPPAAQVESKLKVTPILEARVRYETVDQDTIDASALTVRTRAGAEAKLGAFALLAEAEATVAAGDSYNAFPFALPGESQWRPAHSVIADPENIELNRLQLQYRTKRGAVTAGRQRINLDDQRWVGSVGWRQNEQTFDALRGEAKLGPLSADLTYAVRQRTIFGADAGPRTAIRGDFIFAGVGSKIGAVEGKLFSYLLDFDEMPFSANSSQTYGGIIAAAVPLGPRTKLTLRGSYARQSDYAGNASDFAADYWSAEAGTTIAGFNLSGGWERLGADNGIAVQTPMATLHKFNGWADMFLTTPPAGLEDAFLTVGRKFDGVRLLPGLNASVTFHQFDSARGDAEYGSEWDASVGFKLGKAGLLLKYADYEAESFGRDTRKLWLQAEWAF